MKSAWWLLILLAFNSLSGESMRINSWDKGLISGIENNRATVKIEGFLIEDDGAYSSVTLKNSGYTNTIGMPKLPAARYFIKGRVEDIIIKGVNKSEAVEYRIEGGEVFPVQHSVRKDGKVYEFEKNSSFYASEKVYPEEDYRIYFAGYLMGEPVTILEVFPFKYYPSKNEIRVNESIEISFINAFSAANAWDPMPSKYLIVVPSQFKSAISDFARFKSVEGYNVSFILSDTCGSASNTDIKNAIQSVYDTSGVPLKYVLLAGDVQFIPHFIGTETDHPPTDLYYSTLFGTDYLPDVYIGRFPANDTSELRIMTEKTIMYESAAWDTNDSWINRAYLMASDDPTYHPIAEGTQNYAASLLRSVPMTVDSFYDYYSSGTGVSYALNEGRGIAIYTGHGSELAWAGPSFSQSNIEALTNGDMLPYVGSHACLTGNYAYSQNCFGETWVKTEGRGSVSYWGSSVYSYWDEDDVLERKFVDALVDSQFGKLGRITDFAKMGVYSAYSGGGASKRYYEMYNILGDPSMPLLTGISGNLLMSIAPVTPVASPDIEVEVSSTSYPVEGVLVSFTKGDSLYGCSYTGSDGQASLVNVFSVGDTVYMHASKANYRSSDAYTIIGNSQFYPYIEAMTFNDTVYALNFPDSLFSAADSGIITLKTINRGVDTIFGLSCSLYVYGANIAIQGWMLDFDDTICPGDTAESFGGLEASVSNLVKNGQRDSVFLFFKDTSGSNTLFKKSVYFKAPELKASEVSYDRNTLDLQYEDTLRAVVRISNKGYESAKGVNSYLITDEPYLEILQDTNRIFEIMKDSSVITDTVIMVVKDTVEGLCRYDFSVVMRDTLGREDTTDFNFYTGRLDYLVIDYDLNNNSGPIIDSLLNELGYAGDYSISPSADEVRYYRNVFLCLGAYPANHKILAADALMHNIDSLAQEGMMNVYAEGGECWYWDPMNGGYDLSGLFGINGVSDGPSFAIYNFAGAYGTITNGMQFSYMGDYQYLDIIEKKSGAADIFTYNTYCHGVSYDQGDHRTVGLSLEIGSLRDDSIAPSTRKELVYRIMDFFSMKSGTELFHKYPEIYRLSLLSTGPNISNLGFTLKYASPANTNVKFYIYNSAGRLISQESVFHPVQGVFTYKTGKEYLQAPSGIYFIRMDDGKGNRFTKKLAKIK